MRKPITLLPKVLADQIAAGEVIEGPLSVVKELVENALDADATEISILLKNGGCDEIVVTDNGHGMGREDIELCIERHATSKIQSIKDVMRLRTHGFRGEALAAIAAASKLKITSGYEESPGQSISLEVDPLREKRLSSAPYRRGTTVCVQHLFSWIPARKKFLRSAHAEAGRCKRALWPLMLMHPGVSFTLRSDGDREPLYYPAVADTQARYFQLFLDFRETEVFKLKTIGNDIEILGFLSNPMSTQSHSRYLYLGVNHRIVQIPSVLGILKRSFSTVDGKRGFPWGFLHFNLSPSEVDFNVDPKKDSVRFVNENQVVQLLQAELNRLVEKGNVVMPSPGRKDWMSDQRSMFKTKNTSAVLTQVASPFPKEMGAQSPSSKLISEGNGRAVPVPFSRHPLVVSSFAQQMSAQSPHPEVLPPHPEPAYNCHPEPAGRRIPSCHAGILRFAQDDGRMTQDDGRMAQDDGRMARDDGRMARDEGTARSFPSEMRFLLKDSIPWSSLCILGVVDQLIICAVDGTHFYYFDQHALHERVTYEQYCFQYKQHDVQMQPYLLPEKKRVEDEVWETLRSNKANLHAAGFDLDFEITDTGKEIILKASPVFFKDFPMFDNLITWATENPGTFAFELEANQTIFIANMACKHSIRRGDALSTPQVQSLFTQADRWVQDAITCPHGRPFVMKIPFADIYKTFYRERI